MSSAASVSNTNAKLELYTTFIKVYIVALIPLSLYGSWLIKDQFSIWYTIYLLLWGLIFKNYWVHYKSKKILGKSYGSTVAPAFDVQDRRKFIKKVVLIPAILIVLLLGQFSTFCLEILITQLAVIENTYLKMILSLIPTILTAVLVKIFTLIFVKAIGIRSNYIIIIWTSYVPLFITLFVYIPLGYKLNYNNHLSTIFNRVHSFHSNWTTITSGYKINQFRFMDQFKYFIITNQVVLIAVNNVLPKVLNKDVKFIQPLNLRNGYLKYLLNLGFLIIFSNVWSLAPLISLVFVLINYYIDSYKIKKGKFIIDEDLDMDKILTTFNWLASLVQPALIFMYRDTMLPGVGTSSSDSLWFSKSPLAVDKSFVLAGTFIIEHLAFGLDKVLSKLTLQKYNKEFKSEQKQFIKREPIEEKVVVNAVGHSTGFKSKPLETEDPLPKKSAIHSAPVVAKETSLENVSRNASVSEPAPEVNEAVKPIIPDENSVINDPSIIKDSSAISQESDDHSKVDLSVGATLPELIPTSTNYDFRHGLNQKKEEPPSTGSTASAASHLPIVNSQLPAKKEHSLNTEGKKPHVGSVAKNKVEPVSAPIEVTPIKSSKSMNKKPSQLHHRHHHHSSAPQQKATDKPATLSAQAASASLNRGIKGIEKDLDLPSIKHRKSNETILSRVSLVKSDKGKKKKKKLFGIKI